MQYKVLIVDDDPMVAMINEQYVCKNQNFTVCGSCRNGQDAISFLETNQVDLIVLDVYMPIMDGIDTLKKIRELNIDAEVIMVTAANDTSTIEETMHLGVMDYLIKPFAYERFKVALEKLLAKKKVLTENQVLDQNSIDKLIHKTERTIDNFEKESLPKGIQRRTLSLVKEYFESDVQWSTAEMISEKIGISVVTIRNYLNFLVEKKFLSEEINYSTGGRPSMMYKKN